MTPAGPAPSSRAPRVLVVGPIYGGSLETARSTARASEGLGAETRLLDFDAFGAGWHSLSALPMAAAHRTTLRVEYAKVLGEMSGIRQNQGYDVRISNAAASALNVSETDKFIVRVNY